MALTWVHIQYIYCMLLQLFASWFFFTHPCTKCSCLHCQDLGGSHIKPHQIEFRGEKLISLYCVTKYWSSAPRISLTQSIIVIFFVSSPLEWMKGNQCSTDSFDVNRDYIGQHKEYSNIKKIIKNFPNQCSYIIVIMLFQKERTIIELAKL